MLAQVGCVAGDGPVVGVVMEDGQAVVSDFAVTLREVFEVLIAGLLARTAR